MPRQRCASSRERSLHSPGRLPVQHPGSSASGRRAEWATGRRSSGSVNKDQPRVHHDALFEFPDGQMVLLTELLEGQEATLLQLPAQPATAARSAGFRGVSYLGLNNDGLLGFPGQILQTGLYSPKQLQRSTGRSGTWRFGGDLARYVSDLRGSTANSRGDVTQKRRPAKLSPLPSTKFLTDQRRSSADL